MSSTTTEIRRDAEGARGGTTKDVGQYADVNGIKLYYEIHGTGRPLVLLHGGLGAIETWGPNLPALAKGRQVIAIDLQGHGRTADIDRPLSAKLMADDIAALIKHLKLERPDIMGFSLGGGVALQTAIRHPELVGRLVVISTPIKRLLGKIGEGMKDDFDFSKEVAEIKATMLVVAADADIFPPAHAVEVFGLLGGGKRDGGWDGSGRPNSRLAILPGLTHYTIGNAPALSATVIPFLDEPAPKPVTR
jgi:pimeloyl-ACP methyl ester carboxylesterase